MIIVYINMFVISSKSCKNLMRRLLVSRAVLQNIYIYEVQRERQQIASYSLQPPQISLHPHHHHVKVPQSKVHPGSTVPALPRSLPAIAKKCHNQHPRFSRLRQSRQHRCIFASRLAPHDLVCDQESKNKICGNTYYISIQIKPI
jgi:hypothetical protein